MRFAFLLALLAAVPAAAQTGLVGMTPDEVLVEAWAEAIGEADAVALLLDDVAADTTGAPDEARDEAARARTTVSLSAAAGSAGLRLALAFSIALADPAEQATVEAALAQDAMALHGLLVEIAEVASGEDADAPSDARAWSARARKVRAFAGRLGGATAALGIADARP